LGRQHVAIPAGAPPVCTSPLATCIPKATDGAAAIAAATSSTAFATTTITAVSSAARTSANSLGAGAAIAPASTPTCSLATALPTKAALAALRTAALAAFTHDARHHPEERRYLEIPLGGRCQLLRCDIRGGIP